VDAAAEPFAEKLGRFCVVSIDNGFGAGYVASLINRR